jgi:hypothetical protein
MYKLNKLRIVPVVVLIVGLGSAIFIYIFAEPSTVDPFNPMSSKGYIRELQLYGGKFNVLAAELSQWFGGLWHGRTLAFTVGVLSLFLAWVFWFVCTPRHINHDKQSQRKTNHTIPSE